MFCSNSSKFSSRNMVDMVRFNVCMCSDLFIVGINNVIYFIVVNVSGWYIFILVSNLGIRYNVFFLCG